MIAFTAAAVEYLQEAVDSTDVVRASVHAGGCAGFMYDIQVEEQSDIKSDDAVLEYGGLKIVVDPQSSFFADGTTVDYVSSLSNSGFKFTNTQATTMCGCGTSFSCDSPNKTD